MAHADAPEKLKRPSRWHLPSWWANGVAALILLLTYCAPHVSPVTNWPLAVLAMTFTFQIAVHVFFVGWWAFFRPKRMLLSGVLLVAGYSHIRDHIQFFGHTNPTSEVVGKPAKLMSYNVRVFDLYNWTHNKETRNSMFELFKREDPDILCLQEYFYSPDPMFFRTKEPLVNDLGLKNAHERYTQHARYRSHFGIATFTKLPIIARGHIPFPSNPDNQCIWTDIKVDNDTVRVYNAHLASYHFGDEDYKFIKELDTDTHLDTLKSGGTKILKRLRHGFILRADETQRIADHIAQSPYPVVYCGDMNDVPMSYGYARLRTHLDDAFTKSGKGLGGTYIGNLPKLRIDHIMIGPELEAWDFHTLPEAYSDHHAITSLIARRK